jgi:serine/threonine-protein kinase
VTDSTSSDELRDGDEASQPYPRPFGPYRLLQMIDRGGMGEVYLAKHGQVDGIEKFCVVKTLRRQFTEDTEYTSRFVDEARIVVHLSHRNICQVFDVGKVGERYYLAMEFIPGSDLRRVLDEAAERGDGVSLDLCLYILVQLLEALDYAHRHEHPATGRPLGLVHRDVSPQNLMVNLEGEVKLIDFGLARSNLQVENEGGGMVIGKIAYMAPEQLRGEGVDAKSDVFAAGIIAYEMITGERYYEGREKREIWSVAFERHKPKRFDEIEVGLRGILARALEPDPKERLSCEQFLEELERYRSQHGMRGRARKMRSLMRELFPDKQDRVRSLLLRFASSEPTEEESGGREESVSIASASEDGVLSFVGLSPEEITLSLTMRSASEPIEESASETARLLPQHVAPPPSAPQRWPLYAAGATIVTLLGVGIGLQLATPRGPAASATPPSAATASDAARSDEATPAAPPAEAEAVVEEVPPPVAAPAEPPEPPPTTVRAAPPPKPPAAPSAAAPSPKPKPKAKPEPAPTASAEPAAAPAPAPPPPATDADAPPQRMTFADKVRYLETRCAARPCAATLVEELKGRGLDEVPVERLSDAVAEVNRCLAECQGD